MLTLGLAGLRNLIGLLPAWYAGDKHRLTFVELCTFGTRQVISQLVSTKTAIRLTSLSLAKLQ